MAKIVLLGCGVMATALAVPASEHPENQVGLIGSPLDDELVRAVRQTGHHPTLNADVPDTLQFRLNSDDSAALLSNADVIVLGVSSPGIPWALARIAEAGAKPTSMALVTKGLVETDNAGSAPLTYADSLSASLSSPEGRLVGIGGPCIARELALRIPTRVTFASRNLHVAEELRTLFQTDYYRITTSEDIVGVEACAALKNFLCIGVSAMVTLHRLGDSHAKNPVAALFNQAVHEMAVLADWLRQESSDRMTAAAYAATVAGSAFDLAGMGDLHVTVGGGRNSRLGNLLGTGQTMSALLDGPMKGVTVEGVDTGRRLAAGFEKACQRGELRATQFPLTRSILDSIVNDVPFELAFTQLPG